ncbi:MAG TPA: hypothetical protein DHV36_19350, partial [Desulfobacteraceae bacterium]|nr:hypothetical protein [Desulfobacteraceae bacterium]
RAKSFHRLSGSQAAEALASDDKQKATWIRELTGSDEPWRPDLYDILVSMDQSGPGRAAELITNRMKKDPLASLSDTADFFLETRVTAALISRGHDVLVRVADGRVCLGITRQVLMKSRLEAELASIVDSIEKGVPLE